MALMLSLKALTIFHDLFGSLDEAFYDIDDRHGCFYKRAGRSEQAHDKLDPRLDGLRFNDVHNGIYYRGFDIGKLVFDMFPKSGGSVFTHDQPYICIKNPSRLRRINIFLKTLSIFIKQT